MFEKETLALFAAVITLVLTFLLSSVEIQSGANSSLKATYNTKYYIYAILQLSGNAVATVFGWKLIEGMLPNEYSPWLALLAPFTGVFAFEGVLTKTNIEVFDKKLLAFQDLISKAKTPAIARAIAKDAQYLEDEKTKIAREITVHCNLDELRTYLLHPLPTDEQKKIKTRATRGNNNEHMYLALELVSRDPNRAKALINNYKPRKRFWRRNKG